MMTTPLFSVILPTYNHAHFLKNAIESVLDQVYTNFELLIIDNHSIDNTDQVIASFSDQRIRTFKILNDGVIAASRNMGIIEAKGEWIAFLDSDDIWYSNKLFEVLKAIQSTSDVDVLCHNELFVNENSGRKIKQINGPITSSAYRTLLIEGNRLSTSSTVISSKFLKNRKLFFRENKNLITVEDYDFWLLCAKNEAKFYFIDEILAEYRIHSSNASQINENYFNNLYFLIKDHCFNHQEFTIQKQKLYKLVCFRVTLSSIKQLFRKRMYSKFLLEIFKVLVFKSQSLLYFTFRNSMFFK